MLHWPNGKVSVLKGAGLSGKVFVLKGADLSGKVSVLKGADLSGKVSVLKGTDLGLISAFTKDLFPCWVMPVTFKFVLQCLPVKGSGLGLIGLVSVYCDWMR